MTQEEKQLLFKDLSARLPYGVKLYVKGVGGCSNTGQLFKIDNIVEDNIIFVYIDTTGFGYILGHDEIKPYLRSFSQMTEKEKEEFVSLQEKIIYNSTGLVTDDVNNYKDFIHQHHLDDGHFIEKKLAYEAPEDMYNIL